MAGIIIVHNREKGKTYECRLRLNGQQKSKTFKLRRDADAYLARHSNEVHEGTYRALKKIRFEDYLEDWKTTNLIPKKLKPSTINGYASNIAKHIKPEFEGYQMVAIDVPEIKKFESKLLQKLSRRSVRGILVLLNQILEDARKERYIRTSPMEDVDLPKIEKSKKGSALNPEEVSKLLAQCSTKLRPVVLIGLLAGLRRSEVFALHWTDEKKAPRSYIDFEANLIRVRQNIFFRHGTYQTRNDDEPAYVFGTPKSETSIRDVPLSPALRRELLALRLKATDKQGLIFQTAKGTPVDPNNVCRWEPPKKKEQENHCDDEVITLPTSNFVKAAAQADIGPVRFHDLRHTYGSMKINQGENIYDVQRWMGHSSIQVTIDVYGHPDESNRGHDAAVKTDTLLGLTHAVAGD